MSKRNLTREEYLDLLDEHNAKHKQFHKHVKLQEYHLSEPLRIECNRLWNQIKKYQKENGGYE